MNRKDDITPEQKLLNLIRGAVKKTPKEKHVPLPLPQQEKAALKPAKEPLEPRIAHIEKQGEYLLRGITSLNFTLINRLILLCIFLGLVLFLFNLYFAPEDIARPLPSSVNTAANLSLKPKENKPYSYYQEVISKRNLFKSESVEPKINKVVPAGQTFKELVKDLQLLGIMSGDKPQAIVEDKKLNKTYFLNVGDYLGEIKLEKIGSDNITLEFHGEEITLFL